MEAENVPSANDSYNLKKGVIVGFSAKTFIFSANFFYKII